MSIRRSLIALAWVCGVGTAASAQSTQRADSNIVYGMVAGAAMLMDVHYPPQSNGLGVVLISGSGWGVYAPYVRGYDSAPLKIDFANGYVADLGRALLERGYTVFMINHRFAPAFQYTEITDDARRAVRFIRVHAREYRVDPDHLGAVGHSSGAYLAAMIGLTDRPGQVGLPPRAVLASSRVQAVITIAAPFDLVDQAFENPTVTRASANLVGSLPERDSSGQRLLQGAYADASPITHVTSAAAPMLMYHAKDDPVLRASNLAGMYAKLQQYNVPSTMVLRETGGHEPKFDIDEIDRWFQRHLRR